MTLSCSCDYDHKLAPGRWEIDWVKSPNDFEPLQTSKRQRCKSCNTLIDVKSLCIRFERVRYPYTEIEADICGFNWYNWGEPNIKMSPIYICEKCGEIFLNLQSVGFECVYPTENMNDLLKDYQNDYAPPKLNL
jgi:hypothetical protein